MSVLNDEIKDLLDRKDVLKSIATISRDGIPHVVYKGSLHMEDDLIVFDELLESSQNNKNMVYSLWFEKRVSINILDGNRRSFEIIGKPVKVITCGRKYENEYVNLQEHIPDSELSGIWYIEPLSVDEKTYTVRKKQQDDEYPVLYHLDRLVKK
jgi:hypothetical protein